LKKGSGGEGLLRENSPASPETWLSTKDTAWVMGKTERTIRYWVQYKTIPCARGAGEVLRHKFRAVDLLEWLRTTSVVKDPAATHRLISLMSVAECPSNLLVDYIVNVQKGSK
jgi:hypothetical protein